MRFQHDERIFLQFCEGNDALGQFEVLFIGDEYVGEAHTVAVYAEVGIYRDGKIDEADVALVAFESFQRAREMSDNSSIFTPGNFS